MAILAIGPNSRKAKVFSSVRAASRVLSGTGADSLKSTIHATARKGGYVRGVWVQDTNLKPVR